MVHSIRLMNTIDTVYTVGVSGSRCAHRRQHCRLLHQAHEDGCDVPRIPQAHHERVALVSGLRSPTSVRGGASERELTHTHIPTLAVATLSVQCNACVWSWVRVRQL